MRDFLKRNVEKILQIVAGVLLCVGLILFRTYGYAYWADCTLILNSTLIICALSLLIFGIILKTEESALRRTGWFYVILAGFAVNNRLYLYSQIEEFIPAVSTIPEWVLCIILVSLVIGIVSVIHLCAITDFKGAIHELLERNIQEKGQAVAKEQNKKIFIGAAVISISILLTFLVKVFFIGGVEQGVTYQQLLKSGGQVAFVLVALVLVIMFLFVLTVGFAKNWRKLLPTDTGLKFVLHLLIISVLYLIVAYQLLKDKQYATWVWGVIVLVSVVVVLGLTLMFYTVPKILRKIDGWFDNSIKSNINTNQVIKLGTIIAISLVVFALVYYHAIYKNDIKMAGLVIVSIVIGALVAWGIVTGIHAGLQILKKIEYQKKSIDTDKITRMVIGSVIGLAMWIYSTAMGYGQYGTDGNAEQLNEQVTRIWTGIILLIIFIFLGWVVVWLILGIFNIGNKVWEWIKKSWGENPTEESEEDDRNPSSKAQNYIQKIVLNLIEFVLGTGTELTEVLNIVPSFLEAARILLLEAEEYDEEDNNITDDSQQTTVKSVVVDEKQGTNAESQNDEGESEQGEGSEAAATVVK